MTKEELRAAAAKLRTIEDAQERLASAKSLLDGFNKRLLGKDLPAACKVSVTVDSGDSYGNGAKAIQIELPWGIVQQQLIHGLARAERYLIQVGG